MRAFIRNMAHFQRPFLLATRCVPRGSHSRILATDSGWVLVNNELQELTLVPYGVTYRLTRGHFLADTLSSGGDLLGEAARKKG